MDDSDDGLPRDAATQAVDDRNLLASRLSPQSDYDDPAVSAIDSRDRPGSEVTDEAGRLCGRHVPFGAAGYAKYADGYGRHPGSIGSVAAAQALISGPRQWSQANAL